MTDLWRNLLIATLLWACAPAATTPPPVSPPSAQPVATGAADKGASNPALAAAKADRAYWKVRTDAELDTALDAVCADFEANGKPVLLTFSASWCQDCKLMRRLEKDPDVAAELAQWNRLIIEPGKFDRHVPLLQGFGVSSITWWVAAHPQDCRLPAPAWTRTAEGSFEPTGGKVSKASVLAWLTAARSTQ